MAEERGAKVAPFPALHWCYRAARQISGHVTHLSMCGRPWVTCAAVGTADDGTPGMRVVVAVQDKTFVVPVGTGTQSIRWLAMVASQRYKALHIPGGRSRQVEAHLTAAGSFLPVNVKYVASGKMIGPTMLVKDAIAAVSDRDSAGTDTNSFRKLPWDTRATPPLASPCGGETCNTRRRRLAVCRRSAAATALAGRCTVMTGHS